MVQPYPGPQYPPQRPPAPPVGPAAMRVDLVQGTPFGVAYPLVEATPSGPAVGSLTAGMVSVLVSFFVTCLGLAGATDGWGPVAGGAFTVLAVFLGLGAGGLALFAMRQIRAAGRLVSGRGLAITGLVLGSCGAGIALLSLALAFFLTAAG